MKIDPGFVDWLAVPGFFLLFAVTWILVVVLLSVFSGWQRLARQYAGDAPADMDRRHFCALRFRQGLFDGVAYRGCITIGVNSQTIYLRPIFPFAFAHKGLLIPFAEMVGHWNKSFLGDVLEIEFHRCPGLRARVSGDVGRWIEETAMAQRGS